MGRDKAFLEIDGVPLWSRQIGTLAALHPREIFIAGPRHAAWISAGCEIITDAQENAGPLAGLVAGLRRCATPLLLALGVDLPCMSAPYLRALLTRCEPGRGRVPLTDRLEPLAAVYPRAVLALAEEQLAGGEYSLQRFADRCIAAELLLREPVSPADLLLFHNVNTPADFQKMQ